MGWGWIKFFIFQKSAPVLHGFYLLQTILSSLFHYYLLSAFSRVGLCHIFCNPKEPFFFSFYNVAHHSNMSLWSWSCKMNQTSNDTCKFLLMGMVKFRTVSPSGIISALTWHLSRLLGVKVKMSRTLLGHVFSLCHRERLLKHSK